MDTRVLYARFSSQSQNEQSIESQVRICEEFAEGKDINIVNVYSDKLARERATQDLPFSV